MPNRPGEEESDAQRQRRRIDRQLWVIGILCAVGLAMYLYARAWSTHAWRLADGRSFQVLNWDRDLSIALDPAGAKVGTDSYFWVRYYASSRNRDSMLVEARGLAPLLYPIADSLGFQSLHLDPSYPVGSRTFPLAVISWHLRFKRDRAGRWKEAGT
jgi:hypothetical protein